VFLALVTRPVDPEATAALLLARSGFPAPTSLESLPGGRNNRVWKVNAGARCFLLKNYYWSEADPRDRLGHEWAFLTYLRDIGCTRAPAPLAFDTAARSALLEFIPGPPAWQQEIGADDIRCAADFLVEINADRGRASGLPPVSEACFSPTEHLEMTAARLARLSSVPPLTHDHREVRAFVASTLQPLGLAIDHRIREAFGAELESTLPREERCLSPSDFGFHNALRQPDGTLRFLDFEYAGWDDPAKTIIDFCNQPDLLLPGPLAALFRERCCAGLSAPGSLLRRIRLLEPLYQLKWACICLNVFLPGRGATDPRPERSLAAQLARARVMAGRALDSISSPSRQAPHLHHGGER
jgi:hypothetical protein